MTKRILRVMCMALLGLVLFDGMADLTACHDDAPASASECHACACGPHILPKDHAAAQAAPQPPTSVSYEPSTYAFLHAESFFRPPKLAA